MKAVWIFVVFTTFFEVSFGVITYQLYTQKNRDNGQPLVYKNKNSISKSNYNAQEKNKVLIHSYGQNGRSDFNKRIKDALLDHDNYNVIVVDWSTATGGSYKKATKNVPAIGKSIAEFIDWMKLDEGFIHLIGFGMGAHVAGVAGKQTTNGRVDKITGLDPVKTGFNINQSINRIAAGDARHVEIYHSNGNKIGLMAHIADADKYLNDGTNQPNCATNQCSHEKSWKTYVDQINGKVLRSFTCETLKELEGRGCGYLPMEWFGEKTGITQILTDEKFNNPK